MGLVFLDGFSEIFQILKEYFSTDFGLLELYTYVFYPVTQFNVRHGRFNPLSRFKQLCVMGASLWISWQLYNWTLILQILYKSGQVNDTLMLLFSMIAFVLLLFYYTQNSFVREAQFRAMLNTWINIRPPWPRTQTFYCHSFLLLNFLWFVLTATVSELGRPWEPPQVLSDLGLGGLGFLFYPLHLFYNILPGYVIFGGYTGYDAIMMSICNSVSYQFETGKRLPNIFL